MYVYMVILILTKSFSPLYLIGLHMKTLALMLILGSLFTLVVTLNTTLKVVHHSNQLGVVQSNQERLNRLVDCISQGNDDCATKVKDLYSL